MGSVTVFTSARMQEIEDGTVVSGLVDVNGHLLLKKHDNTEIDAGNVKGSDAISWLPINYALYTSTADYTTYPLGLSSTLVNPDSGWPVPSFYGNIMTNRAYSSGGATIQYWSAYQAGENHIYYRIWYYNTTVWSDWMQLVNSADPGYRFLKTVKFESSSTFSKADYPGIKAIRVKVVGGGGAGAGSSPTASGAHSVGGGGGGGGYAEAFILEADLSSSEVVTIGAGGAGASNSNGAPGVASSFGFHASANGGLGGFHSGSTTAYISGTGGPPGVGTIGDFQAAGSPGGTGTGEATLAAGGIGGSSIFGGGGTASYTGSGSSGEAGADAISYGGGGGGSMTTTGGPAQAGGSGSSGIVIVDVYV